MMSKENAYRIAEMIFEFGEQFDYGDGFRGWFEEAFNFYFMLTEGEADIVLANLKGWYKSEYDSDEELKAIDEIIEEIERRMTK